MRRFRSPCVLLSKMLVAVLLGYTSSSFGAQPTLKEAVEAAWAKQPEAIALSARQEEMTARRDAATSLFPAPPSVALAQRTDRYNQNHGEREIEAEIAVPLWTPGTRSSAQRLAAAESSLLEVNNQTNKLKLAGEVRDAYWQARFAQNDYDLATRKAAEAAILMQDVERRVKAGDLARTDLNQAQGAERLARAILIDAKSRASRALRIFTILTGMAELPLSGEDLMQSGALPHELPQLAALAGTVQVNQARLAQASATRRDPPEIAVGVVRERPAFADGYDNSVRFSVRIPLASQSRNAPLITTANADLIEAQAALGLARDRMHSSIATARDELEQAYLIKALAQERYQLTTDTQVLYAKSFRLGELDLSTRLRSENERFEAELALSRASLEIGRAVSRLNQALGILP